MIKKSDLFNYSVPVTAGIFPLENDSIHLTTNNMTIITVLSGGVMITKGNKPSNYKEGDVSITGINTPITLRPTRNNTNLLIISIDTSLYRNIFPYIDSAIFDKSKPSIRNKMLSLLLETAFALTEQNPESYTVINENIKAVLKIALDDCQYFSEIVKSNYSSTQTQADYISLMQNILHYIDNSYMDKISLSDFAEQQHMSNNYMSHLIRNISGTTFKELLAFFRCKKAELLLLDSTKRINEISHLVGFSAPSYFKNSFEKFYKITPEQYRQEFAEATYQTSLPDEIAILDARAVIREFATKHNITLSITHDRFYTMDKVYIDHYIEHFQKVLSDEGSISNIDAEMNESSHEAFINMQKEFRMSTITLDASVLMDKAASGNQLTIATNINYLIWSKFKIKFVIHSLSSNVTAAIVRFMKFYFRRFNETLDEIAFSIRVNAPEFILAEYKINLTEKLREEVGPLFRVDIESTHLQDITYYPYLYDSFIMAPFAMDELFHPENWKLGIDFSLIDAVSENGYILAGGCGLLTWNGIKKPWWHAYNLASKLRGSVISKGPDHIITNNNGIITILTYNMCGLPSSYLQSISSTQDIYDTIQNKSHIREHSFQLMNTYGKYKIITYSVNEASCLFSKWAGLDYPEYLTLEEETVLSQICHPEVKFSTVECNGKIDITTREDSFGVTCVVLEKVQ